MAWLLTFESATSRSHLDIPLKKGTELNIPQLRVKLYIYCPSTQMGWALNNSRSVTYLKTMKPDQQFSGI